MVRFEFFLPIIFILAAAFYALLGLYAWRRRPAVAVVSFAWVMLSMSIWSFAYGLEVSLPALPSKLLILNFEYIGIVAVPVFLFFFALDYTGRSHLIAGKLRPLAWVLPFATLFLVWTNAHHHFMWDQEHIVRTGALALLSLRFNTGFWIQVYFALSLIAVSGILLLMDFLQSPRAMRLHVSLVILGGLFSLFFSTSFIFGYSPIQNVDFAPLFFLPAAAGLAWVTLRYRLSEILSLEHLAVLKNMKDGVIVLNEQRRILYINPVTERLFNRTEDEVIGQPLHQVDDKFAKILNPYLTGGEQRAEVRLGEGAEAKAFELVISSFESNQPGSSDIVISLRDITRQKEKEGELSRRGSIMSAISMAAEQFLIASDWEKNIPAVLKNLGQAADVCRVYIVLNSTDEQGVVYSSLKYEWTAPGVKPQIDNPNLQRVPLAKTGFDRWLETLSQGQSIHGLVKDLPGREAEFIMPLGSLSIMVVPIFVEKQWWAFMMFDECRYERQWTDMELNAFQTAASIFGAAETQRRTAKKLLQRQLTMSLLQQIVTVSLKAADMREMAETVANRLAGLIKADGCFLTLWDENNQQAIPFAAYNSQKTAYSEIKVEPGTLTFTQSALRLERTLIVEDTADTAYASPSITRLFPTKSLLAIPLIGTDKKLGAVLVAFDTVHRFDAEEVQICEQAASLIALALEKFQAMEEAKRKAATSETLRKAGIAVAEKLDFRQAVNHLLEELHQVVPYDSASVQLLVENELEIVGGNGWENVADVIGMRFSIPGDNPNSVVIETGKPYRLANAEKIYKKFNEPPHNHIRSWLGVPLIVHSRITGLLAIDSAEPDDFSDHDIEIALEFANQVAVILENARILQETQTQAVTDALTGVYNRRGLYQFGELELQRTRRINRPFSAMMFDIDHFKKVNDQYGHAAGDQILRQLAQRCLKNSRATDFVGRYGGEEFVILLVETSLEAASMIAERLRTGIMKTPFNTDFGEISITASLGVSEAGNTDTLETLIGRADAALYNAKKSGRNRVVVLE